jgi:hypothetical protein
MCAACLAHLIRSVGSIFAGPHQHSFLVPSPVGLMTIFYFLATKGVMQHPLILLDLIILILGDEQKL